MEVASGSSDGEVPTPQKSSRARTPQSPQSDKKLVVFKLTYAESDNDDDGFLVTVPGKKDGPLLILDNIPKVWSVKNLGQIFDKLFTIYKGCLHGTAEDTVKSIIDAGLALEPNVLNENFNPNINKPTEACKKYSPIYQYVGHISKNAFRCETATKRYYCKIATGSPYPQNIATVPVKERAKLIMTWLSSYLILCSFGDREEVRAEHGKLSFSRLLKICETVIPNVFLHFMNFWKHDINKFVRMDQNKFTGAQFLTTIKKDDQCIENVFMDQGGTDVQGNLKSKDVDAGEVLKCLVKQVTEKSEIILRNKKTKQEEVSQLKHVTGRQANLLNILTGKDAVEQYYKRRYEEDLNIINSVRALYYKHRNKVNMPTSCTVAQFLSHTALFIDSEYKKLPVRPTEKEEKYHNDTVHMNVIERVQIVTKEVELKPSEVENMLYGSQEAVVDDTNQDNTSTEPVKLELSENKKSTSPPRKRPKVVVRNLDFENETPSMPDLGNFEPMNVNEPFSQEASSSLLNSKTRNDLEQMKATFDDLMTFHSSGEPSASTEQFDKSNLSDDDSLDCLFSSNLD